MFVESCYIILLSSFIYKPIQKFYIVINFAESELEFRDREFQTEKREKEISENSFLLISNDIFLKELRPIYSNQYGYYL